MGSDWKVEIKDELAFQHRDTYQLRMRVQWENIEETVMSFVFDMLRVSGLWDI